jgi:AcrR family transcriptional regulator
MNDYHKTSTTVVSETDGRDRILRGAHTLFLERGFSEVSMQQIADAAGMTKAALYYHFRNKEELFAQVVRHEVQRFISGVTAQLDADDSFEDQLRRFVTFVFGTKGSDFSRLIGDFKRHVSAECQQKLRLEEDTHDPLEIIRPYFDRARASGQLRDVNLDHAMMIFFSMVGGLYMISEQKPDFQLTDELAATMVDAYLHGVGAPLPASEPR